MKKIIILCLFFITTQAFAGLLMVVMPAEVGIDVSLGAEEQKAKKRAEDTIRKAVMARTSEEWAKEQAENDIATAEEQISQAETAIERANNDKQAAEKMIKEADEAIKIAKNKKADAKTSANVVIWINSTQHYTGTIPAKNKHIGEFTLPVSGTITSFSARFHTNADTSQNSNGGWLCGNHGGQGDGYLNDVHISYSREGSCGKFISDMGFSNNNLNVSVEANRPIIFRFKGYAGAPWHSSSYSLYIVVRLKDEIAMEAAKKKAQEAIREEDSKLNTAKLKAQKR